MNTLALILPSPVEHPALPNKRKPRFAEADLIQGMRDGNKKALEAIYQMYSATLYGIVFRIVKKEEVAEDVLQETFIRIWQSFSMYDVSKGRLYTWMSNVARNLALDQIKTRGYRNSDQNDDICVLQPVVDLHHNSSYNPDTMDLRKMTAGLKPEYKCILDLVYFKGYTHTEASQELGIPMGTLKTRLRMAVNNLREIFACKKP